MVNSSSKRIVFFDLDGTLHQEDMFGCFLWYLIGHLPMNIILVIPMLVIVALGFLIEGRTARWPMSLLLWSITFGHSEMHLQMLEKRFSDVFRRQLQRFPLVLERLENHLVCKDTQVWLITGSPESLVKKVYFDSLFFKKIKLIGSRITRNYGGWVLTLRCLGHKKVTQLESKLGIPLKLYSGYSDSVQDTPMLYFCKYRWRVTSDGKLKRLN
ncbi:haloacid dehalogenase superfamily, subfamily IF hydrolase, YfhB [secondary endosymbiont of Heteropsylla cubana]|uniref:Phosphatidylglycerophosphatase C n=1 Tax=secondary endosymbiont of Heteropsylla cubana TaxID=134287 RepID=J3TZ39_9ENTR|nr:phosphatidylglycerophosphatase C [secondary endosymbiont of Heteropsylla cubana]AFP85725.1 haloacid dehalogenase superfamily, subfamily IF hydrolase, YfhB [secondary endosymbiont of Heteropsylla cubana]